MTERRRFLRFDTALGALCDIVGIKHKAPSKVVNISKEGALVLLDRSVDEGEEIHLSMDVPGDNVPVFAACRVAWQKEAKAQKKETTYETGVKFIRMGNADKGKLLEYIYLRWLRELEKE